MANILLVDDDHAILQQLSSLIRFFGYTQISTIYPEHVFQILKVENIDLILLDVHMPKIDGVTLLKELKAHPAYSSIPVIMLTSDTNHQLLETCFKSGAVDFINKPLNKVVLHARIHAALTVQQSIAELKKSKQEVQESLSIQESLNDALMKTTQELKATQEYLIHAQKMKALGTFAGGLAHDFNNILSIILGNTELMLIQPFRDAGDKKSLKEISRAVHRAKRVVKQLLNFSTAEERVRTSIQIDSIVKNALQALQTTFPDNIEIHQVLGECPPILAVQSELHHAIVNICLNARESMGEKGGTLKVVLESIEFTEPPSHIPKLIPGSYVHLMIQDTGCGIPPENMERIFDPFFTTKGLGGTSLGPSKDGTGLGLSIAYSIIETHNGVIQLESKVKEGTAFHLYFPALQQETAMETATSQSIETIPPTKTESSRKLRILVADDELILRKLYADALELEGHQVILCHDGEEALEIFSKDPHQFDLVFTDQEMPKMTGTQLCQKLLNLRPDLPVFLITGYSPVVSMDNFQKFGFCRFFMKPFDFDTIIQAIREVFDERNWNH